MIRIKCYVVHGQTPARQGSCLPPSWNLLAGNLMEKLTRHVTCLMFLKCHPHKKKHNSQNAHQKRKPRRLFFKKINRVELSCWFKGVEPFSCVIFWVDFLVSLGIQSHFAGHFRRKRKRHGISNSINDFWDGLNWATRFPRPHLRRLT